MSEETANADVRPNPPKFTRQADPSHISFEALKRALTTSLLRAEIINRQLRLLRRRRRNIVTDQPSVSDSSTQSKTAQSSSQPRRNRNSAKSIPS